MPRGVAGSGARAWGASFGARSSLSVETHGANRPVHEAQHHAASRGRARRGSVGAGPGRLIGVAGRPAALGSGRAGRRSVGVAVSPSPARGGACGWLRLQCRRPRNGAQAARFARARPDGRPAGALRPRRWRRSPPGQPHDPPREGEGGPDEPLDRHRPPHQGPEAARDRRRHRDLHAADRRQARRQAGPGRLLRRQVLRRPGARVRATT